MQGKEREVETLTEYTVDTHLTAIKDGDFALYENEYELVKHSLGLPLPFMELGEIEQQIALLYIDPDFVEPNSKKHTKNNMFISFLATYKNQDIVKKLFKKVRVEDGHDRNGQTLYKEVIQPDPEYTVQRLRLKTLATSIWSRANLKEVVKGLRDVVENDGYRDEELLERKIIDDALSSERDSYTLQNRKMAMDIKGLKKPSSMQSINVFLDGGGEKANRVIVEASGNQAYDLIPNDVDE